MKKWSPGDFALPALKRVKIDFTNTNLISRNELIWTMDLEDICECRNSLPIFFRTLQNSYYLKDGVTIVLSEEF